MSQTPKPEQYPEFPTSVGDLLDERFRLKQALGEGPIHQSFLAFDILENRQCCLKVPRSKFRQNTAFCMRYRRDLLELMTLNHPSLVTPYHLGEHLDVPFQALELLTDEPPFAEWFENMERRDEALSQFLRSALDLLHTLHHKHGRHHGAIKPNNLLVRDGRAILTDLAVAGRLEDYVSTDHSSPQAIYCSPEQLSGERVSWTSDLYCLGLVVYQGLARRHPYQQDSVAASVSRPENRMTSLLDQLQTRPSPPSNYAEDVPRWADRFLLRCLDPHPVERFQNHSEASIWLAGHSRSQDLETQRQNPIPPPGREEESKTFDHLLQNLAHQEASGALVRLHGPLGSGKRRLLEWLSYQANMLQVAVVSVEPSPESGLHLQSLVTAVATLFPQIQDSSQAIIEGLVSITVDQPMLLIVHQARQADETLLELLRDIGSLVTDLSLLLILVDDEKDKYRCAELAEFLSQIENSVRLENLDHLGVSKLIEERAWTPPNPRLSTWIHAVTEGKPLHASLLIDYLLACGIVSQSLELDWAQSPPNERPSLQHCVDWKLKGISPRSRPLLEAAAVLGHHFRVSTLNAITYHHDEEVDAAIAEARELNLVKLDDSSGGLRCRWTHPILRRRLLEGLPERKMTRIHRLAAAFYSRGEPEPAKMAYHFLRAKDDRDLIYWGSLAAQRAREANRRGECNFWLNQVLLRVPTKDWFGPPLAWARTQVARDQSEALDLELWFGWLKAISGREEPEMADDSTVLLNCQRALSVSWDWDKWDPLAKHLKERLQSLEPGERRDKALRLLIQSRQKRAARREPKSG